MTSTPPTIHEIQTLHGSRWQVHNAGRHVPWRSMLTTREQAQAWADVLARLPDGYLPVWHRPRAGAAGALAWPGWRLHGPYGWRSHKIEHDDQLVEVARIAAAGEPARAVIAAAQAIATAERGRILAERHRRHRR
ncbi:MAG: hypothetical protein AB7I38_11675 [Dehalococcoidia bacterium]